MILIKKIERRILNKLRERYQKKHNFRLHNHVTIDTENASLYIRDCLLDDKPFMIGRIGSTEFECISYSFLINQNLFRRYRLYIEAYIDVFNKNSEKESIIMNNLVCFSGFFPNKTNLLNDFYNLIYKDLEFVDVLGVWLNEDIFRKRLNGKQFVTLESIEPYLYSHPWSEALAGKKVLVIHPFSKTIEMQYANRHLLFDNKKILPEFELKTITAVQTIAGEESQFATWFDALEYMKFQINEIDFDIAIIGCGAYGFPLAAYIKRLGKKAVHLGGATQILFGIKGKRWEQIPAINALMNEHWVRPLPEETPIDNSKIEGGCYW